MGFNLGGAISGAISGFTATGSPWGAVAGGALGGFTGDDASNAESAYNRQLNDSIKLWNMQNAYNDPVHQMERLNKAGLNPYLVYSSGNVTGNSSSSINQPTLSYAQTNNQPLNNFMKALSIRNAEAETRGKEVDTEKRELELQLMRARIAKLATGNGGNNAYNMLREEKLRKQIEQMDNPKDSGSLLNVNTWLNFPDKFSNWAKSRHLDNLDQRLFQYALGNKNAFNMDFQ